MIITQNGEAKAALMDIKAYEDLQESLAMPEMTAQENKSRSSLAIATSVRVCAVKLVDPGASHTRCKAKGLAAG